MARRRSFRAVRFEPMTAVFKPEVKVQALRDLNGWVSREKRLKWHMSTGSVHALDSDTARDFAIKGYVMLLEGKVRPASEQEIAETQAGLTTIHLGVV